MSKSVILITIAGALWVATGGALAQSASVGRAPTVGVNPNIATGLLPTIPSVSALNRPLAVSVARIPENVVAPQGGPVAASGRAVGLLDTTGKALDKEKSAKESGSSKNVKEASLAVNAQRKELHQLPTCN